MFHLTIYAGIGRNHYPGILTEHWTESMPSNAMDLQWTMKIGDEIERTRGNQALATQGKKPKWLRRGLTLKSLRFFCFGKMLFNVAAPWLEEARILGPV